MASQTIGLGMLPLHFIASAAWLWMTFHFLWRQEPLFFFIVFFFVGICWLLGSILHAVQLARFGNVTLSVADPVPVGGKLSAVLRTKFGAVREVTAILKCHRISWRNYDNEHLPHEELVWSRTARFPVNDQAGIRQCRIEFDVPAEAEPTREHQYKIGDRGVKMTWQTPGIRWHLKVRVDSGVGLDRDFFIDVVPAPPGRMTA